MYIIENSERDEIHMLRAEFSKYINMHIVLHIIKKNVKLKIWLLQFYLLIPQLGAESADSIGAVLNSKDELKEIEETRETCRWAIN